MRVWAYFLVNILLKLEVPHFVASLPGGYYTVAPKNTAQVKGQTVIMGCEGTKTTDTQLEWLDYITTTNGHRIALNHALADDVSPLKYQTNRTSQRSTAIYILSVDEGDVAKYACRLVTSDVWAYSYVVLLESRPICGHSGGDQKIGHQTITVNENELVDLGCELTYMGQFRPDLTWNMEYGLSNSVISNAASYWFNQTLTHNITVNATEELNGRNVLCKAFFNDSKGINEPPYFPADTDQTEYDRDPPKFTDSCTVTLNVLFSPRDLEISASNGSYHVNMTLQIDDYIMVSARANPQARYKWKRISGNGDTVVEGPQLNITRDMIGWNEYLINIYNTYTRASTGSINYTVRFFTAAEPSPPRNDTPSANSTIEECVVLSCDLNLMQVTLNTECFEVVYPDIDPDGLTLEDPSCFGQWMNGSVLQWNTSYGDCSTRKEESPDYIHYSNMLIDYILDPNNVIIVGYTWKMNLSCYMSRNAGSAKAFDVMPRTNTILYKEQTTSFDLSMTFYDDDTFSRELTGSPLYISLGDPVYVEVKLLKADLEIELVLNDVIAYSGSDNTLSYELVKDKCIQDNTTVILNASRDNVRFRFNAFRFVNGDSGLYLRATGLVCISANQDPRCNITCQTGTKVRRKRAVRDPVNYGHVTGGPIVTSWRERSFAGGYEKGVDNHQSHGGTSHMSVNNISVIAITMVVVVVSMVTKTVLC